MAVAIRQIQRSIAAPLLHCTTAPPHPLHQRTSETSKPPKQRATEPPRDDRGCSSPANLSFIDGSNLQLLVNYLRSRCRSQIADRSGSQNPRHASVLITTKNNDRLRLLEAIWPATFSLRRTALVFIYPFMIFFIYFFFRCCLINRSKFIG